MSKIKKYHLFLTIALIAIFALGALGIKIFASQISNKSQTSVVKIGKNKRQKIKNNNNKIKRHSARELLAQLNKNSSPSPEIKDICMYMPPEKPKYTGEFIQQETKIWAQQGGAFEAALYIKNIGNTAWFGDQSNCPGMNMMRLGTARNRDRGSMFHNPGDKRWITANRIAMAEARVNPGEIATFRFKSNAPAVNDIIREYFQPVVEGIKWMADKEETAHIDLYVGENDQENEKRLFYLGKSGQASVLDISGEPSIDIDISEQKLLFKFGDTTIREYMVSTGTFKTPTPLGRFKILNKQELRIANKWPHYHMPKWQGFTQWGHGLHSLPYLANDKGIFWNEAFNHIGQRVSHGCIRLLPDDAEDLYNLTAEGISMVIHE